jgi:hypothetical protein
MTYTSIFVQGTVTVYKLYNQPAQHGQNMMSFHISTLMSFHRKRDHPWTRFIPWSTNFPSRLGDDHIHGSHVTCWKSPYIYCSFISTSSGSSFFYKQLGIPMAYPWYIHGYEGWPPGSGGLGIGAVAAPATELPSSARRAPGRNRPGATTTLGPVKSIWVTRSFFLVLNKLIVLI